MPKKLTWLDLVAQQVAINILDVGLAKSTFREQFPEAYAELLVLRPDFEEEVRKAIRSHHLTVRRS